MISNLKAKIALALAAALSSSSLSAQEAGAGRWQLQSGTPPGSGSFCGLHAGDAQRGLTLRVSPSGSFILDASDPSWNLSTGTSTSLTISLDGKPQWSGYAKAVQPNQLSIGVPILSDPSDALSSAKSLTLSVGSTPQAYDLTGFDAMKGALDACISSLPVVDADPSIAKASAYATAANMALAVQHAIAKCGLAVTPKQKADLDHKAGELLETLARDNLAYEIPDEACPDDTTGANLVAMVPFVTFLPPADLQTMLTSDNDDMASLIAAQILSYAVEKCDLPPTPKQRADLAARIATLRKSSRVSDEFASETTVEIAGLDDETKLKAYCERVRPNLSTLLANTTSPAQKAAPTGNAPQTQQ